MAKRKLNGGLRGQFKDRAQFSAATGVQIKVNTQTGEIMRLRGNRFKRCTLIKNKEGRELYLN